MIIDLAIHSFSLWHHFRHSPGFDALAFIELAHGLGFTGINLSLNDPGYRHLGGREVRRVDAVRAKLAELGMSLEIDTSGTAPDHLAELLAVAQRMGATSLRTYTRHGGTLQNMINKTTADLAQVAPYAAAAGVVIVLENHEDFTGPELASIVEAVDHAHVRILYDYGNSQMVLEDPEEALTAVLPYVHSVHVKDHVMVRPEDAGRLMVAGVPMGDGFLPIRHLTRRLLDHGLRRITFENVWAYTALIREGRKPIGTARLGAGAFRFAEPPFDPALLILVQAAHTPAELVRLERLALDRGLSWFRQELRALGVSRFNAHESEWVK